MKYYGFKSIAKFPRSNLKNLGFANGMSQVIKSLFANNEQGFAFDFNDLSTMYQDVAGTIPVTDVGQPVGRVLDKSGRGNHATQPTSAKRPILQQNATTGAYYLAFDGVDDHLVTSNVNLTIANNLTIFAGIYKAVDSGVRTVLEIGDSVDTIDKTISINTYSPAEEKLSLVNYNNITTVVTCTNPLFNAPKSIVFTGVINNAEGYMFEQLNKTTKIQKTITPTNNTYTNFAANIGNRVNGSRPWSGHIYNLIGISRVATSTEITNTENAIAKNVGVTL